MAETKILAPFTAVRLAWAVTGKFSSDADGKLSAQKAEEDLKRMQADAANDPQELSYVSQSAATIRAAIRNLEIIYKGRKLNFEENEKLRQGYLDNAQESIAFGKKAKDYLSALPSMAIAGPGVAGTLGPTLASAFGFSGSRQTLFLWGLGVAMAGIGYWVHWIFMKRGREKNQKLYLLQDYERNLYYEHYIVRVQATLSGLYRDIDNLHKCVFGDVYPVQGEDADNIVGRLLDGVKPSMCPKIQSHMAKGLVTPDVWTLCEVGEIASRDCKHFNTA
jgi:hypothetical protein